MTVQLQAVSRFHWQQVASATHRAGCSLFDWLFLISGMGPDAVQHLLRFL